MTPKPKAISLSTALPLLVGLVISITTVNSDYKELFYANTSLENQVHQSSITDDKDGQVQGSWTSQDTRLYISGSDSGYNGGVISQAVTDEPSIQVSGWNISTQATIKVYKAGESQLLSYLVHDSEGKQLNPTIDTNGLELLGQVDTSIQQYEETQVTLPMEERGVYVLEVTATNAKAYGIVVRSSTGVVIKEADNQFIFWGQEYTNLRSISQGSLTLYSLEDSTKQLESISFNEQGIATSTLLPDADIALFRDDGDLALVPINLLYLNTNYQWQRFDQDPLSTKFYGFTDRPLYQPTDTLYFKAYARDDDDARFTIPSGKVRVIISSGYWYAGNDTEPLYDEWHSVSESGAIDGSFSFEDLKPGYYSVTFLMDEDLDEDTWWQYQRRGYTAFQIEHFRKPDYSIELATDSLEYESQSNASITVSGSYFFGEPLDGESINYQIRARKYYVPSYYRGVQDFDGRGDIYGYGGTETVSEGVVELDTTGTGSFSIPLATPDGESQLYTIYISYEAEGGEPVQASANILVYAGDFEIYRSQGRYSYSLGDQIAMGLDLYDHSGNPVVNQEVMATVTHEEWIRVEDQNYKYGRFEKKTTGIGSVSAHSQSDGSVSLPIAANKPGYYRFSITATDSKQRKIFKEYSLWVTDKTRFSSFNQGDENLSVIASKEIYDPGEVASITILSQVPDRDVLLSIERGRVQRYQVVSLQGNQAIVDVPLIETDMPNVFMKATSFSTTSLDSAQSDVEVSAEQQRLNVLLTPDKSTYGPGDTVELDIETKTVDGESVAAEVSVWAVDKAIYELMAEFRGDIFDTFWKKRFNDTTQGHSLEGILVNTAEGGGCFADGTMILMGDGSSQAIETVQVGDEILTRASDTDDTLVKAKVLGTITQTNHGYLILNQTLKVTPDHKMFVNNSWKNAGSIQAGDTLIDAAGLEVEVTSIEWLPQEIVVHNLEIEEYHTYFAGDMYVHNQKGDPRTSFSDTAYWNPSVQTGNDGKATVRFELPDNLTTWSVAAVGATRSTIVGQSKADITVSKSVVVRPVVPNLLRVGDEMQFTTYVHNFTDQDQTFDFWVEYPAAQVFQEASWDPNIPSKGSRSFSWRIVAGEIDPEATIEVGAAVRGNDELADVVVLPLPIEPYGITETTSAANVGDATYTLDVPADARNSKSSVRLNLASSLLGNLSEPARYLIGYPYGCTEQTTSKFIPTIIAVANPELFSAALEGRDTDEMIKKGIERLSALQQPGGGWSWWYAGGSDSFISAYVVEYLSMAKEEGYEVDQLLREAHQFFSGTIQNQTGEDKMVENRARVIKAYALSFLDGENIEPLVIDFDTLVDSDLLAMAVMVNTRAGVTDPDTSGLTELESRAQRQGEGVYWEAGTSARFGSISASTALAVRALAAAGGDQELMQDAVLYFSRNRETGRYWENTFATAQTLHALSVFSDTGSELDPDFDYEILLAGKELDSGSVSGSDIWSEDITINLDDIPSDPSELVIKTSGQGTLYSTFTVDKFRTDPELLKEPVSNGITIARTYQNAKGPEYSVALGDEVKVTLTVSGLNAQEDYAVIEDQLPAGMVAINHNLANQRNLTNTRWWANGIRAREVTKSGIVLSIASLQGTQSYTYDARVVAPGTYNAPPARVELMYAPELWGRTGSELVTIDSETVFNPLPINQGKDNIFSALIAKLFSLPTWQQLVVLVGLLGGVGSLVWWLIAKLPKILKSRGAKNNSATKNLSDTQADQESEQTDIPKQTPPTS